MFPRHGEDMTDNGEQLEGLRGLYHLAGHGGDRSKRSSTEVSRALYRCRLHWPASEMMVGERDLACPRRASMSACQSDLRQDQPRPCPGIGPGFPRGSAMQMCSSGRVLGRADVGFGSMEQRPLFWSEHDAGSLSLRPMPRSLEG
jgi:hypothetical protein